MPFDIDPAETYTPEDVALRFRVTTRTVRYWIKSGLLTAYQLPSRDWRIQGADALASISPNAPNRIST